MTDLTVFAEGVDFGEGPRWDDGKFWYSDFYQHTVYSIDGDGVRESIVEVPGQPSGLGCAPDGCTLDSQGAIWFADAANNRVARVVEGGEITDEIMTGMGTFACMLGGDDGKTLFVLTAPGAGEADVAGKGEGIIYTTSVEYPAGG